MSKTVQEGKTAPETISFDPFSFLAKNLAMVAAVLYAAGWIYLNSYFAFFGIDLNQLDLSWNDVLVYSINAGRHIASYLAGPFLIVAAVIACVMYYRRCILNIEITPTWMAGSSFSGQAAMVAIGVALFALIVASADAVGRQLAIKAWRSSRDEIIFRFDKKCTLDVALETLNAAGRLLMLKSTAKYYFVFARTGEAAKEETMHMRWFKIPAECVHYAEGTIMRSLRETAKR